jgi:hypothetical protein
MMFEALIKILTRSPTYIEEGIDAPKANITSAAYLEPNGSMQKPIEGLLVLELFTTKKQPLSLSAIAPCFD